MVANFDRKFREVITPGAVGVITGAARGIGEGIARAAAARGMKLVLADIASEPLQAVVNDLGSQGVEAIAAVTDVTDPSALRRLADVALESFGEVHLLVNNAGIEAVGLSWELAPEEWERILKINVLGLVNGVRAFAPRMIAAGKSAAIVNVASIAAVSMLPLQTAYIVSKHAALSFTECLYLEMQQAAPHIQVSVVVPGSVATRIFDDARVTNGSGAKYHRRFMQQMLGAGMTSSDAGRTIMDQIEAGEFWITTDHDMLAKQADARAEYLSMRRAPTLGEGAEALFE